MILLVLILVIFVGYFYFNNLKKESKTIIQNQVIIGEDIKKPISMCYMYSRETDRGFVDRVWLSMNILGDEITGEYQSLLAEKDSKIGNFSGKVEEMDPSLGGRIALVWWNSLAEGMNVTEELEILFGEGSAVTLLGEMVDRGDGTYVYKDKTKLNPGLQMSQIDCERLRDMTLVEKYVRNNINTIVKEKPVLGGSWYVTILNIIPSDKSGTMMLTFEDGHIQSKKEFNYSINGDEIIVLEK